jgi:hypothetical protein
MPQRPLSDLEIEERAASASALLHDPVVEEALRMMQAKCVDTLMVAELGSPEASSAHATMKVIAEFKASLNSMITDKKMREKYPRSST